MIKMHTDFKFFFKENCHVSHDEYMKNPLFRFYSVVSNFSFDTHIQYDNLKEYLKQFILDKDINSFSWNNIEEINYYQLFQKMMIIIYLFMK